MARPRRAVRVLVLLHVDEVAIEIRDENRQRRSVGMVPVPVVEGGLSDVLRGRFSSGAHPQSVLGAALSIIIDHEVPVYFCSDRQAACRFVQGFLLRFHRKATRCETTPAGL